MIAFSFKNKRKKRDIYYKYIMGEKEKDRRKYGKINTKHITNKHEKHTPAGLDG